MERTWKGIWLKGYLGHYEFMEMPPAPYFRKEFVAPKNPGKAIVHLCGIGWHELYVNGKKADDRWYAPGLSQYDCRVGYIDYDVTALLKPGKPNAIVVHLGNGFYNCRNEWKFTVNFSSWRGTPRFICDVDIDGETVLCSGIDWKFFPGPVVFDCHHAGEDYDARREIPECFLPGFDDSKWKTPERSISPGGVIELDTDEPCRVIEKLKPVKTTCLDKKTIIYDLGKNFSGVVEFTGSGKAGDKVTIRYAEQLGADGHIDTSNVSMGVKRFDTDTYTFRGDAKETWHPRFVWHGLRYVEIELSSPKIKISDLTGLFISSDLRQAGTFTCSDKRINKLQEITLTSYRSNFMAIPTDCPTREKFGWTGDADVAMEIGFWNYFPKNGLERLEKIIADFQRPDGNFSTHGPSSLWGMEESCPTYTIYLYDFPYFAYLYNNDDHYISKFYDKLKLGMRFFEGFSADDHLVHMGYADWCNPLVFEQLDHTKGIPYPDCTMVESIAWLQIARRMTFFAEYTNHTEDATHYRQLADQIKNAINNTFFDAKKKFYNAGYDWASNAMALNFDVVPAEYRQKVADNLVKLVRAKKHQMWAGIQGAKHIPMALADNGYIDDAYQMLVQSEFPGWGYIIKQGATSLWETWTGFCSKNHIMFGACSAWFYRYLGGLYPLAAGFSRFQVKPYFPSELKSAEASYETPTGKIVSSWKRAANGKITLKLVVPADTHATLILPGQKPQILAAGNYTLSC